MTLPSDMTSKAFRDKAEECRAMAESFRDPDTKATMLRLAVTYEHMAATAERYEGELVMRQPCAVAPADASSSRLQ
jgi:hypothetical protein